MSNTQTILEAVSYPELHKHTVVLSKAALDYYLWVHLDADVVRDCMLYEYLEQRNGQFVPANPFAFDREGTCWVKVHTSFINKEAGLHVYRFNLVNKSTDDVFSLYVGYVMQDNCPDKPYVYMKRDVKEECSDDEHIIQQQIV